MRVLLVGGLPDRLHDGVVEWAGHQFWMIPHRFDRIVDFSFDLPGDKAKVDRSELDVFIEETRGYDAIFCESPEAFILAQEWRKRGVVPSALLSLEVHSLLRVRVMQEWYKANDGIDPWPYVSRVPWIAWIAASSVQGEGLVAAGVSEKQVHHCVASTATYSLFLPDADALFDGGPEADGKTARGLPSGGVLVPGSGRRDPETHLRAAAALPELPFVVVDAHAEYHRQRLAGTGLVDLPNVQWLDPLPIERFIALLRRARLVVVSLLPGTGDGGHTTVCIAHRLGVAVVCSDVPGIADYVVDGETAHLVTPGDPAALASAVLDLWNDERERKRLARGGSKAEHARVKAFEECFLSALDAARAGLAERHQLLFSPDGQE